MNKENLNKIMLSLLYSESLYVQNINDNLLKKLMNIL